MNEIIKFVQNIKPLFRKTISWNRYMSEIKTQLKSNKLDYMIDPAFRNINDLFVLSFKNGNNDPTRYFLRNIPIVDIKNFNALINN